MDLIGGTTIRWIKGAIAMKQEQKTVGRRDVLRALGAGAGIAATSVPLTTQAVADSETDDQRRAARYKETEHVKTFYRVNRYPAK